MARRLAFLLVTFALVYSACGYFPENLDSLPATCGPLMEDALGTWCAPAQLQATARSSGSSFSFSLQHQRARQKIIGALWKCQGLLGSSTSSEAPKLRVLVWDLYEPWLETALARFSDLYGVPLDLDPQPYERLVPSIRAGQPCTVGEARQPPPPQRQPQPHSQPSQQLQGQHAVWLHSSADTQALAREGLLMDIGDLVEKEQYGLDWFNVGRAYRLQLAPYAGRTVAMPLDGTLLHLFYRADVLQTLGELQVPQTWTQLVEFATTYGELAATKGAASGSGAIPAHPICIARDVGCRHESYLQAIWSSIAQTRGSTQPTHFDAATMRPLLDSAAGSASFRILAQLLAAAASPEPDEGCSHGSLAFARGRCALALAGFAPQMQMLSQSRDAGTALPTGAVVQVSELPGSELVSDHGSSGGGAAGSAGNGEAAVGSLTRCTPSTCPYGTPVAAAGSGQQQQPQLQQVEMLVNRAPQAATSLLVGAVNSRLPLLVRLVGFELLAFLASPDWYGTDQLAQPLWNVFPVRPGLLQPPRLDAWRAAGYDTELVRDAMATLYTSMTHPNMAWGLRMPGQAAYNKLIGDVVTSILNGNVSVDPWVASSDSAASKAPQASRTPLAQVLSRGSEVLAAIYTPQNSSSLYETSRQPWAFALIGEGGCRTRSCRARPAASSSDSNPRNLLLAVLLGVLVPVAVVGLALLIWAGVRCCHSHSAAAVLGGIGRGVGCMSVARRGSRKMHVPGAGVEVALCVTDIQDSTSLWELLPADTLARAVDIHHRCVRRLALRHGGYESSTEGDSFILAFSSVRAAVAFAIDLQTQLLNAPSWPKLLLEQEVCRPVYTRLPAGYPFSHAASSRTAALSPRARRSSWGFAGTPAATPSVVTAASAAAAAAGLRVPDDPAPVDGSGGGGTGGGGLASDALLAGDGAAARWPPPSPRRPSADHFRSSTGGMMPSSRPALRHCPASGGSALSRAGSAAFPRGRSLGDLVQPSQLPQPQQGPMASASGVGLATVAACSSGSSCARNRNRLHFPEPVARAVIPAPFAGCGGSGGGSVATALGSAAATAAAAAAAQSLHRTAGWCQADVCSSVGGASCAEEVGSSPTPPTTALPAPVRSCNEFKQQVLWPGDLRGSSSSFCRPLGAEGGSVVSRRASLTCRGEVEAGADLLNVRWASDEPEAHRRQHLEDRLQQPRQQQQHTQQPQFARNSVATRFADQPNGDSEPLPVWCDSGPLAGANFSIYSNTTYVTDGTAGGAVSFVTNGRLWDDGDGDYISSASNAVFSPTRLQSGALGPSSSGMVVGAAGPAAAGAAAPGRGTSLAARGGCQTLLEALQGAASAAAARTASADDRPPSGHLQTQVAPQQQQQHTLLNNHHHHHQFLLHQPHEHLVFRGLRVRVGISVAVPTAAELQYNVAAARMVYGGPCVAACKALADLAHGGQVFLSARAHQALAAECQGLGGKPPGTMVLQVALIESTSRPPPSPPTPTLMRPTLIAATADPQPQQRPSLPPSSAAPGPCSASASLMHDSCYLSADALALQSWHAAAGLQSPLPRVPEHALGGSPKQLRKPQQDEEQQPAPSSGPLPHLKYSQQQQPRQQQQHPYRHQSSLAQLRLGLQGLGMEPVYLVTSPTLSQRLALVPPPRFSPDKPPLQDVYRAPLGHLSYAVVRVPAAVTLLRWDGRVAADSMRLFVQTAVSELRRAPGAYLVSASPAEVRATFPCPVLAVAWALHLRAALLRAPWPAELLTHELGEPLEAHDGGSGGGGAADASQPASESGTPRLRWTSLAALSRANGSREGSAKRAGTGWSRGGSVSGAAPAPASELPLPLHLHGALSRMSGRPGGKVSHGTAAMSRAELLRAASAESDGDGGSTGCLEPLPRIGASPPLRRHRHSIDCHFPASSLASVNGVPAAAKVAGAAAAPNAAPAIEAPSDGLIATEAWTGPEALEIAGSIGLSPLDRQSRALALLADHLRSMGAAPAAEARGSGGLDGTCSGGGRGSDFLPSTPSAPVRVLPFGAAQPPARPHALRRATADGIAPPPPPQRHQQQHLQSQLLQQPRSRMAAPVAVPFRQRWPASTSTHQQHQEQQRAQEQHEGTEPDEAAAAASCATPGTSFQAVSQFSFRSGGLDGQATGTCNTADEAEEVELGLPGGVDNEVDGGGGASAAAATNSLLRMFPSGDDGAGDCGGEPCSDPHDSLPVRNLGLSRLNTWASSYLYVEGSGGGAAARPSGSGVSDSSGPSKVPIGPMAVAQTPEPEIEPACDAALCPGPVLLGVTDAAELGGGLAASAQPNSSPLFAAPFSGSLLLPHRSHHDGPVAATSAVAAAAGATTSRQQLPATGKRGRLLLRGLRVHVGVATGHLDWAISGKTHALVYTGRAVNRAIRLSEAASSGKVLCDRGTHRAIQQAQQARLMAPTALAAPQQQQQPASLADRNGGLTPPGSANPWPTAARTDGDEGKKQSFDASIAAAAGSSVTRIAAAATGAAQGDNGGGGGGAAGESLLTERVALDLQLVRLFTGARLSVRAVDEAFLCELRSELVHTTPPLLLPNLGRKPVPSSPGAPQQQSPVASGLSAYASAPSNVMRGASAAAGLAALVPATAARQAPAQLQLPTHSSGPLLTGGSPGTPHTPTTPPTTQNPRPTVSPGILDSDPRSCDGGGGAARRPRLPPRSPVQLQYSPAQADSGDEQQQQRSARYAAWRRVSCGGSSPGLLGCSGSENAALGPVCVSGLGPAPAQHLRPQYSLGAVATAVRAAAASSSSSGGGGSGAVQLVPGRGPLPAAGATLPSQLAEAQPPPAPQLRLSTLSSAFLGPASDCGFAPSIGGPASSGLLSTGNTIAQQQSSLLRLTPTQRFRSVTADGHMPYIICGRVDEEGEGCSEDASCRGPAEADAEAAFAVAGASGGSTAGAAFESGASAGVAHATASNATAVDGGTVSVGDTGGAAHGKAYGGAVNGWMMGTHREGPQRNDDPGSCSRPRPRVEAAMTSGGDEDAEVSDNGVASAPPPRALCTMFANSGSRSSNCSITAGPCALADPALDRGSGEYNAYGGDSSLTWRDSEDATSCWSRGNIGMDAVSTVHADPYFEPGGDRAISSRAPGGLVSLPQARSRAAVSGGLPPALTKLGGGGVVAAAAQVTAERLPPPLVQAWRHANSQGRPESPRLAAARGTAMVLAAGTECGASGGAGREWGFTAGPAHGGGEGLQEDECGEAERPVEGEFEFMPNSRSGSATGIGTGGGIAGTEVTARSLLQGRLLAQMSAAAAAALKADSAAAVGMVAVAPAALAQSPMSPALLMTIGSSGRRGSANISGSSYLYNSGSGGLVFSPPTFAGMAQLPPGGPSEASSAGSSFRLVAPSPAQQQ